MVQIMAKQNIALEFEKAEYYTLQEASDYLNLKYNTNNINPKKLIKSIYQRSIQCYVYFKSDYILDKSYQEENDSVFTDISDYENRRSRLFCEPIYPKLDENIKINEQNKETAICVLNMAFSHNFFWSLSSYGLFLMPNDKAIFSLTLPKIDKAYCSCFVSCVDMLHRNYGEDMKEWDSLLSHAFVKHGKHTYRYTNIRGVSLLTTNTDPAIQEQLAKFLPFECRIAKYDDSVYFEPCISIDDLVIFDEDLEKLENDIIKNNPIPTKKQLDISSDSLLAPRTANNASKIILALSELAKIDLSQPYSKDSNGKIAEVLERQGNSLSDDTIAQWLQKAYDIGK